MGRGSDSSGLESVSESSSNLFGSHPSSSAMESMRMEWKLFSFSIASADKPLEASRVMSSQVCHSLRVAASISPRFWPVILMHLLSCWGIVARSAENAWMALDSRVRKCS